MLCAQLATLNHQLSSQGLDQRNGVAHLMLFYNPLENQRTVRIADNHASGEWAEGVRQLVQEQYPDASKITLVMDNLSTHTLAHALLQKREFVFTPKHGSWLNMAEAELFRVRWSEEILRETDLALAGMFATRGHDVPESLAARQIAAIRRAFPDALVYDYEEFKPGANILPDADDATLSLQHVDVGHQYWSQKISSTFLCQY